MSQRIEAGPLAAAAGGLVLLVSLFLHWYQPALTAWRAFEILDLVLAALALAPLALLVRALWPGPGPVGPSRELAPVSLVALAVVVSQMVQLPPAASGRDLAPGAWVGLAGALLMTAGAALSARPALLGAATGTPERPAPGAPVELRRRRGAPRPMDEAADAEPLVQDELYPHHERHGPIGATEARNGAETTQPVADESPPGQE